MELMLMVFFISLLIIATGAVFKKMQDISLTEPFLAMGFGILLGPDVINLIESNDPALEFKVLKTTCEFTIAMALMATALRLPPKFFRKNRTTQSTVVLGGMILMWLLSSGIMYLVFPDFDIVECLLLGAIVTPTDPVVASTIVTGEKAEKHLTSPIRNTLSFESGANDGLAYPIVLLGIFLVDSADFPLNKWITQTVLYETMVCGVIAYLVGLGAGKIMHHSHKAGYMNTKSLLPFSLALAFVLLAGLNALNMNGIIGVFIGGLGFAHSISGNEDLQEERVQESMERIFTIPVFFIFGMMLPWNEWFSMGWVAVILVLLILFFRRIPALLALMPFLPKFKRKTKDVLLMGWFGPIGVAALYYAVHSEEKTHLSEMWFIPALIVFASTIVHGITSVPLSKKFHEATKTRKSGEEDN